MLPYLKKATAVALHPGSAHLLELVQRELDLRKTTITTRMALAGEGFRWGESRKSSNMIFPPRTRVLQGAQGQASPRWFENPMSRFLGATRRPRDGHVKTRRTRRAPRLPVWSGHGVALVSRSGDGSKCPKRHTVVVREVGSALSAGPFRRPNTWTTLDNSTTPQLIQVLVQFRIDSETSSGACLCLRW